MAAIAVQIAEDIKTGCLGMSWLAGWTVERKYHPPQEQPDAVAGLVTIVPLPHAEELSNRGRVYQQDYSVDVAIHKLVTGPEDTTAIDNLLDIVEQTRDKLKTDFGGCNVVGITNDPLWNPEMIQKGIFASVITVTCRTQR